ncbi:hypothetical protein [Acetobacter pasteurianus]|uniref:Tetratricopeptide repeat protein n=1 Tax=Acetobacter pasteurianus subsp. pasteurianus TaxID=481145 RepID=A0A1Y0XWC6_ACEPA|nr:hypothetical protein [Acetobacter pasteurianus]ARW47219.1 hypothetical protein S1001342_00864 [Acetobacter pasteurianus subsp. pasteurianus]
MLEYIKERKLIATARSFARKKEWSKARDIYEDILKEKKVSSQLRVKLLVQYGHSLKENGEQYAALDAYKEAIKTDPLESDPYLYAADLERELGDIKIAQTFYAQAIIATPQNADLWRKLSQVTQNTTQIELIVFQESVKRYKKFSCENVNSGIGLKIFRSIARKYARKLNWQIAKENYAKAISFSKNKYCWNDLHKIYMQMGHCEKELNNLKKAEFYYRLSASYKPIDPEVYSFLHSLTGSPSFKNIEKFLLERRLENIEKDFPKLFQGSPSIINKEISTLNALCSVAAQKNTKRYTNSKPLYLAKKERKDIILRDLIKHFQ